MRKFLGMCAIVLGVSAPATGLAQGFSGDLIIGSSFSQTPWGFFDDNQQPTGIDVSVCGALAEEVGASSVEWVNLDFRGLIPAMQADRFHMICAGMYITAEREEVVTMIPYVRSSQAILTQPDAGITSLEDLCARSVSVLQGSAQLRVVEEQDARCKADGLPAIAIQSFDTQPVAVRALENGNVEAFIASDQLVSYYLLMNPDLEKAASNINPVTLGIAVRKDNNELANALREALVRMKDNGTYDAIMEEWGIETAALESFN